MIGALILYKLKFYLKFSGNPWRLVLSIFLMLTAGFYGFVFGAFTQLLASEKIDVISPDDFIKYTLLLIFIITVVRMIFPTYRPLRQLFPKHYPLSGRQRYGATIFNDFVSPYFLYLSIFIVSGSLFANKADSQFLISGFLILICAHLFRRSIQYLIDFSLKLTGVLVTFVVLLILTFGFYNVDYMISSFWFLPALAAFLFISGFVQDLSIKESRSRKIRITSFKSNLMLKLLFNNPKVKLQLIIAFTLKTALLLIDLFLFRKNGEHLFDGQSVYWLFLPPLIYFTYVYNNIWAFWFNLWLNLQQRIGDYKVMIQKAFYLMLFPLILDMAITLPILLMSWDDKLFILTFYFTSTLSLVLLSFLWSIIAPKKITAAFQFSASTSSWGIAAALTVVFLLSTINLTKWAYLLVPLFLILSGVGIWYSIVHYKDLKYIVFNKMKKG